MSPSEIANLIEDHRDRLVAAWVEAVRADDSIMSDADISDGGIINHVPILVEEICDVIRSGQRPGIYNTREARVHAYTRFRQGYRARDLVRETALLRRILFDYVAAQFYERAPDPSHIPVCLDALRIINSYVDEELRYAVAIYTESTLSQS
jgi:hypothetical protein